MLDDDLDTPAAKRADLRADVAVMVELCVLKWNGIELAPEALRAKPTADTTSPSKPRSAEQIAEQLRQERNRIVMSASGGPVKTLGGRSNQ